MVISAVSCRWLKRIGLAAIAGLAALALTQAVRSGADAPVAAPDLAVQEPMAQADARLHADGWIPKPDREPLPFERERAGNNLASLSACSGSGMGFCRYDYQRGKQSLAVVTVPGTQGEGLVHSWFNPN